MEAFETILLMLLAAVGLLGVANRIGAPYPALLALAGAGLALAPIKIPFQLDPALALALFVAPVLLDAAYDTSPRDLKANWLPIMGLVLVAVGLTTAAVAWVAHAMVPGLPWAAAIVLGAIVSPPDAAAATAVLREVRLPHRLAVILGGESLLNDASALLIYRLGIGAVAAGGTLSAQAIAPAFLLSIVGSLVAGPLIALVWQRVVASVSDAPRSIILQFISAFGIWVLAEAIGLSPILTVVTYAITVARYSPARTPAQLRVPSYAVWETAVVVLNVLAFLVIGLQLGPVIAAARPGELQEWLVVAAAVLGIVIAMRFVWVAGYGLTLRVSGVRIGTDLPPGQDKPTWRGSLVIGWCGMRGMLTVATALALPGGFPERELLLFVAFSVTLGTLVIQGLTLRPLLLALDLHDEEPVDREIRLARVALADAGLGALDGDDSPEAENLREELRIERRTADEAEDGVGRPVLPAKVLRGHIVARRRERLIELRGDGTIGDDAFHQLEEELDFADLAIGSRV